MTIPKNILIVRTDRIGDVILSLPLATIIKKYFPGVRITFLLRKYTKPIAEGHPHIDEIITLIEEKDKPSIVKNILQLKHDNLLKYSKFDSAVIAYPTFRLALILFLSRIKTRIGTGYRWYSFLFNKKIYDHRKHGEMHELEYNVRLLKQLGIEEEVTPQTIEFNLQVNKESKNKVEKEFHTLGINFSKQLIIVHPGSKGSSMDLPVEKMKYIAERISKEIDCYVLITGSAEEHELCQSFNVNESIINLSGKFNLSELIAVIDKTELLIANSTGPIHIAAALQKNVIGFYPKFAAASPQRWGPYTNKKFVFSPAIECSNCTRKQCEKLNCMESIKAEEVVEVAKNILQKKIMEKR